MADTFTSLHYHVVFSTKGREPWLRLDMQERVWAYLGGIARQNRLRPLLIGGTEDHIHVLLGIPPTVAVSGIDKASRGVQASLARRDGYGPLIPWAEAQRLQITASRRRKRSKLQGGATRPRAAKKSAKKLNYSLDGERKPCLNCRD
jgi:REP element-mobilizing transposase RayT